jgi:hypothetical protein
MLGLLEENHKDLDPDTREYIVQIDDAFEPNSASRLAYLKVRTSYSTKSLLIIYIYHILALYAPKMITN